MREKCVRSCLPSAISTTLSGSQHRRWTLCYTSKPMQQLLTLGWSGSLKYSHWSRSRSGYNTGPDQTSLPNNALTLTSREIRSVTGQTSYLQELLEGVCQVQCSEEHVFHSRQAVLWMTATSFFFSLSIPLSQSVSHPPTVPSLPVRGICSKSLAHEEREAPRFNWQAPCEADLFHYKLSQQAVRQISSIIEPAKQQGQTRSRAWGDVAHKNTDRNFVRERLYFRGYRWKLQCRTQGPRKLVWQGVFWWKNEKIRENGNSQGFKVLAKCWLASTSHYTVSFVVAGLSLFVIERSNTVLPMQTVIAVHVPMSFKIKNDFILFFKYDNNTQSRIIIFSLHLPLI